MADNTNCAGNIPNNNAGIVRDGSGPDDIQNVRADATKTTSGTNCGAGHIGHDSQSNSNPAAECDNGIDLSTILKILVLVDSCSVRLMATFAITSRENNAIFQWKLNRYKKLYHSVGQRITKKFRQRLIDHPIEYHARASNIQRFEDMIWSREGIVVFNDQKLSFTAEFLQKNRLAISNITVWMQYPTPCKLVLRADHTTIAFRDIKSTDYVQIGDHDIYIAHLNGPGESNPILLGPPILDPTQISLIISPAQKERRHAMVDVNFVRDHLDRMITSYVVVAADKYDWDSYGFTINNDIYQWKKASFIRPRAGLDYVDELPNWPPAGPTIFDPMFRSLFADDEFIEPNEFIDQNEPDDLNELDDPNEFIPAEHLPPEYEEIDEDLLREYIAGRIIEDD